jgi:hypothetical protein
MSNSNVIGKYVIVKDLNFSDYMTDSNNEICKYDTIEEALDVCGIYEFENVLILKVVFNHIENVDIKI